MLNREQKEAIGWIAIVLGTVLALVIGIMLLTAWGKSDMFKDGPTAYDKCLTAGGSYYEEGTEFECILTGQG